MFDNNTLNQIKTYFEPLKKHYTLHLQADKKDSHFLNAEEMLQELASTSEHINYLHTDSNSFRIDLEVDGNASGISFRGIPGGHEFTSLLLSILNHEGIGKNLPDKGVLARIQRLKAPIKLQTYVSLTCTNCPDVVQALNIIAMKHPGAVTHEMIDGAMFQDEANEKGIASVPTVIADGEVFHVGRGDMATFLNKLEEKYGKEEGENKPEKYSFDAIILGAGPAGAAASIYLARKGLKVALLAERVGGQVNETVGIENLISVPTTTGGELASNLRKHIEANTIELFEMRTVADVSVEGKNKILRTSSGEIFEAPALIVATGASWRKLNIPGEKEYTGNGVAYCAHCDGPFFKDKKVAVVGGGNSGVEAAIDLANICEHVTIVEFMDSLKADSVLQEKARNLKNVDIRVSTASKEILGDGKKVNAIILEDRESGQTETLKLDGVFVQIGLSSNSAVVKNLVDTNRAGEIIIDEKCRTSAQGIYAAGDCTTVPYKQIIVAMGEGAKAALSAFDDRLRGE